MALRFESFLALRYLRSKRKEVFISIITVISVLGVAISVMVLNIVLAVMTGFEAELRAKLVDASAHITIRDPVGDIADYQRIVDTVRTLPEVVEVYPFTYNQAMLSTPAGARGILIRGIADVPAAREKLAKMLLRSTDIERLFATAFFPIERPDGLVDEVSLPPLIVGKALRDRLAILNDSAVTILSPDLSASPQGLIPKLKRFLVVGVYSSGLVEYEGGLAYTSVQEAQRFFRMGDTVSGIEVTVKDMFRAKEVGDQILNALGQDGARLTYTDWTEPNKPLWDALRLEKQVYFIVLLLLILVASFSIISTLVMVVMEKSKDIAILKSMGARDQTILWVFVLQGAVIGCAGITLGTLLGWFGCIFLREYGFPLDPAVFSLSEVPVHMIWSNFVVVAGAAFIITLGAGIYPAFRAARLRPAEALRFE